MLSVNLDETKNVTAFKGKSLQNAKRLITQYRTQRGLCLQYRVQHDLWSKKILNNPNISKTKQPETFFKRITARVANFWNESIVKKILKKS